MRQWRTQFEAVYEHFFFSFDIAESLDDLRDRMPEPFSAIYEAFRRNVSAVIGVATMPYVMAGTAVHARRFQQIVMAERIRSGMLDAREEEREQHALTKARQRMTAEAGDQTSVQRDCEAILQDLANLLPLSNFDAAADELLRQSTVMTWGAFEVLATDLFVALLNNRPQMSAALFADERSKRKYSLKDIKELPKLLDECGYDLSGQMGRILLEQHRLDDVDAIRVVFDVFYPNENGLRALLNSDDLWNLYQVRNLILHRRAMVDDAFIQKTGFRLETGSTLRINADEFTKYVLLVRDLGLHLLKTIRDDFEGGFPTKKSTARNNGCDVTSEG
jgi:hypothetical protein